MRHFLNSYKFFVFYELKEYLDFFLFIEPAFILLVDISTIYVNSRIFNNNVLNSK
jgi:hypothetical protein